MAPRLSLSISSTLQKPKNSEKSTLLARKLVLNKCKVICSLSIAPPIVMIDILHCRNTNVRGSRLLPASCWGHSRTGGAGAVLLCSNVQTLNHKTDLTPGRRKGLKLALSPLWTTFSTSGCFLPNCSNGSWAPKVNLFLPNTHIPAYPLGLPADLCPLAKPLCSQHSNVGAPSPCALVEEMVFGGVSSEQPWQYGSSTL